jgi:hypothetical protein
MVFRAVAPQTRNIRTKKSDNCSIGPAAYLAFASFFNADSSVFRTWHSLPRRTFANQCCRGVHGEAFWIQTFIHRAPIQRHRNGHSVARAGRTGCCRSGVPGRCGHGGWAQLSSVGTKSPARAITPTYSWDTRSSWIDSRSSQKCSENFA